MTAIPAEPPKHEGKLLSIIMASNRPHNLSKFLFSLNETCADPHSFEVLVKIDEGDDKMRHVLDMAKDDYPFRVRYLQTPKLDGYYTLHKGYQQLFEISDPSSYFIYLLNDELRFTTPGWDRALARYVGFFPDHMFRLKLSVHKYFNYYSYHECGPCPENYPIFTRRWMELAEGVGDCWGPDGWHQFLDYHLGAIRFMPGLFRSVPVDDIRLAGEAAGLELSAEQTYRRTYRIYQEWWRMYSVDVQRAQRRLAAKMHAYVWAHEKKLGKIGFTLKEDEEKKLFAVHIPTRAEPVYIFSYHLSGLYIRLQNFGLLMRCFQGRWGSYPLSAWTYVMSSAEPKTFPLNYMNRLACFVALCAAALLHPFVPHHSPVYAPLPLQMSAKALRFGVAIYTLFYWFVDRKGVCARWCELDTRINAWLGRRLLALHGRRPTSQKMLHDYAPEPDIEEAKKTAGEVIRRWQQSA